MLAGRTGPSWILAGGSQFGYSHLWEFLRESTPAQRRLRYGDEEYDWDFRVDTTRANLAWRERLLGHFYCAYQATEPAHFTEMMASLQIDFPAVYFH